MKNLDHNTNIFLNELKQYKVSNKTDANDLLFCSNLANLKEGKKLSKSEIHFIQMHLSGLANSLVITENDNPEFIKLLINENKTVPSNYILEYTLSNQPTFEKIQPFFPLNIDQIDLLITKISDFNQTDIIEMIDIQLFDNHLDLFFYFLLRACLYSGDDEELKNTLIYFFNYAKNKNDFHNEIDILIFQTFLKHNAIYDLIMYIDNKQDFSFENYIANLSKSGQQFALEIKEILKLKKELVNF